MGTHPIFESDFDCLTEKKSFLKMVQKVASAEEFNTAISGSELTVVDFFATWCGPCRMIAPYLEELSKDYAGKVKFIKVDVDELEDLSAEQEVKAMPTFSFFKDGKKLESFAGANKDKIKNTVDKHLG